MFCIFHITNSSAVNRVDWISNTDSMFGEVHYEFLGMSAKLHKVTISYVTSVHLSAWNNLTPTG